jgi:hypothetical protein
MMDSGWNCAAATGRLPCWIVTTTPVGRDRRRLQRLPAPQPCTVAQQRATGQMDPQLKAIFGQPWDILDVAAMCLDFGT